MRAMPGWLLAALWFDLTLWLFLPVFLWHLEAT